MSVFYLNIFSFLEVKFSMYVNRRVLVMISYVISFMCLQRRQSVSNVKLYFCENTFNYIFRKKKKKKKKKKKQSYKMSDIRFTLFFIIFMNFDSYSYLQMYNNAQN